jgi:hypothetical protein
VAEVIAFLNLMEAATKKHKRHKDIPVNTFVLFVPFRG